MILFQLINIWQWITLQQTGKQILYESFVQPNNYT